MIAASSPLAIAAARKRPVDQLSRGKPVRDVCEPADGVDAGKPLHDSADSIQSGDSRFRVGRQRIDQGVDVNVIEGYARTRELFHQLSRQLHFLVGRLGHRLLRLTQGDDLGPVFDNQRQHPFEPGGFQGNRIDQRGLLHERQHRLDHLGVGAVDRQRQLRRLLDGRHDPFELVRLLSDECPGIDVDVVCTCQGLRLRLRLDDPPVTVGDGLGDLLA